MRLAACRLFFAVLAAAALSGCISAQSYVDSALPRAGKEDVAATASAQPIQVLYEFRTRGVPNAGATQQTSDAVLGVVRDSGLFSEVAPAPVASGRRLTITIDNVPITSKEEAMSRGFGTGLTFGLVGTMVTDGYVCEARYAIGAGEPFTLGYRHAVHTTIGNASGPPGIAAQKPIDAVKAVVSQLTWSIMRDLSRAGRL